MPNLNEIEGAAERQAQSRAQRRREARERNQRTLVTKQILAQTLDLYDHTFVRQLRAEVAWLMLPWPKRHWLSLKAWVGGMRDWPTKVRAARARVQGRLAARRRQRRIARLERLAAGAQEESDANQG